MCVCRFHQTQQQFLANQHRMQLERNRQQQDQLQQVRHIPLFTCSRDINHYNIVLHFIILIEYCSVLVMESSIHFHNYTCVLCAYNVVILLLGCIPTPYIIVHNVHTHYLCTLHNIPHTICAHMAHIHILYIPRTHPCSHS